MSYYKKRFTLKIKTYKHIIPIGVVILLVACSTKKNTFLSRNSHALSTEYNILYNGGIALDKGVADLKAQYKDTFWELLPVERMQVSEDQFENEKKANSNFERAEEKATKAIQKHAMNIGGSEKNPQMDEAHLLLGKTRYYDQRFVPALEAFNYVLYKYPQSDKIHEVKIWREKTNMRMENDVMAINNLRRLLKEIKYKDQIFADANATLAQAFINTKEKDSAVAKLKLATAFTKQNEEKARYRFILGQLYEDLGYKDSAFAMYQEVIDMNRRSSRVYVIQSHAKQASQFDIKKGDTIAFLKKFDKLLEDRENRPFLDLLNHQLGLFYEKADKPEQAIAYYNKSLKLKKEDTYLQASNYRNIAEIKFKQSLYETAGKYYDSTLVLLNAKGREAKQLKKKRDNLQDVIKYEAIAHKNDSILKVVAMTGDERAAYYNNHIEKIKKEEEAIQKKIEENEKLEAIKAANEKNNAGGIALQTKQPQIKGNEFYFYNPTTVSFGVVDFKKKWGSRVIGSNWRIKDNNLISDEEISTEEFLQTETLNTAENLTDNPKHELSYYIDKIPTNKDTISNIIKDRNFAYYQLGIIYKEKFKEYARATDKLENLLTFNPEERLILPSLYNLYKIYQITDVEKSIAIKNKIIQQYPDSRYAQILSNTNGGTAALLSPDQTFNNLYKDYEKGLLRETFSKTNIAIEQFEGEEILPKMEFLKANLLAKLKGLKDYKNQLNYIALTYPNVSEGKEAEQFLANRIPYLESLTFNTEQPTSWKILFEANDLTNPNFQKTLEKLHKFVEDRKAEKITISTDIYNMEQNFVLIHGFKSKEAATNAAYILKEIKEYKVMDASYIISSENYKIVQMKKMFPEYLSEKWIDKPIEIKERSLNTNNVVETDTKSSITKEALKNALNNVKPESKEKNKSENPIQNKKTGFDQIKDAILEKGEMIKQPIIKN